MGRVNIPHPFNAPTSWYLRLGNEPSLVAHEGAAEPHLYLGNMRLLNPDLFLTPAESWGPNSMWPRAWESQGCKAGQKNLGKCYHGNQAPFFPSYGLCPVGMWPLLRWILGAADASFPWPILWSLPWPASLTNVAHLWLLTPRIRKQKMMPVESFILLQGDEQTQTRMTGLGFCSCFRFVMWIHPCIPKINPTEFYLNI